MSRWGKRLADDFVNSQRAYREPVAGTWLIRICVVGFLLLSSVGYTVLGIEPSDDYDAMESMVLRSEARSARDPNSSMSARHRQHVLDEAAWMEERQRQQAMGLFASLGLFVVFALAAGSYVYIRYGTDET